MSAFTDLTAAIVAALNAAPALAGGNVYRGHAWPMPEDVNEEVFVRTESSVSERTGITGPVDWRTAYRIEIRVRYSPDATSADAAVDDLLAAAYARLAALSLPGVQDIVPGVALAWDYLGGDNNVAAVSFTAEVLHRTEGSTLTAWT